nr:type I secretion system permease/ATPase [Sphingobium boeckii]
MERVTGQIRRYAWLMLALSGVINILGITLSLYIMQVFDRVLSSRSTDTLVFLSIAAALALATAAALDGIRSLILGRLADWAARRLAPDILVRSIERRLVEGNLRSELLRDLSQVRAFISGPGVPSLLDLPWMPIYLIVAFLVHPIIGFIALIGAIILFSMTLLNERLNGKDIRNAAGLSAVAMRDSDAIMRNAEVIDSLGMAPQVASRWSFGLSRELDLQEKIQRRSAAIMSGTRLIRALIQVVLYAAAAGLVLSNEMTGGAMMAGSIIVSRLLAPVEAVLVHWRSLLMVRENYSRMKRFFALPQLRSTQTELPAPRGALTVERLTLLLPGHPMPILRNVDFALPAGEHLAIVGPAASGKTTLSRALLGILRPQSGVVRLDGVDVSKWNRAEFGKYVGYLPQDVELFSGTVAENIARFTACEDSEIIRAARMAGCHSMILSLPDAYDTEIGEGGTLLSGGQRQQVGLARALFGRPRYVILDEPNSNLDVRGENALRLALERLKEARVTAIIVTHRQTIISQMDKLLVLESGAIKMFGPTDMVREAMRTGVMPARVPIPRPDGPSEPAADSPALESADAGDDDNEKEVA